MKDDKLCILLSHFHVKSHEKDKFHILNYVLDFYNKQDCFIILVGHGEVGLPESIVDKVDEFYWENTIDVSQIGRGHPKFCIKGFEIAMRYGFQKILKTRAEDLILRDDVKSFLESKLGDKKLIVSEQTSLENNMIGDLFHYGDLFFMYNLWVSLPWKYNTDGLRNLFYNTLNYFQSDVSKIKDKFKFVKVKDLKWVCVTDSWNYMANQPKNLEHCYWGLNRYEYMGGF